MSIVKLTAWRYGQIPVTIIEFPMENINIEVWTMKRERILGSIFLSFPRNTILIFFKKCYVTALMNKVYKKDWIGCVNNWFQLLFIKKTKWAHWCTNFIQTKFQFWEISQSLFKIIMLITIQLQEQYAKQIFILIASTLSFDFALGILVGHKW